MDSSSSAVVASRNLSGEGDRSLAPTESDDKSIELFITSFTSLFPVAIDIGDISNCMSRAHNGYRCPNSKRDDLPETKQPPSVVSPTRNIAMGTDVETQAKVGVINLIA